uniref:Uncharacterized protein n=1 Tax=Parascaris equorum TaxID=6256 RepID=A0A914S4T6_PAREQ
MIIYQENVQVQLLRSMAKHLFYIQKERCATLENITQYEKKAVNKTQTFMSVTSPQMRVTSVCSIRMCVASEYWLKFSAFLRVFIASMTMFSRGPNSSIPSDSVCFRSMRAKLASAEEAANCNIIKYIAAIEGTSRYFPFIQHFLFRTQTSSN